MKTNLHDVKEFKEVELFGRKALIADERGMFVTEENEKDFFCPNTYLYSIRHDDEGNPCTIEKFGNVIVNHWGTLITHKPIYLTFGDKETYIPIKDEINFLGEVENINLTDYMNKLHDEDNHQEEVFKFISDFTMYLEANGVYSCNLGHVFVTGYCYHFAHILKAAFRRGEVYICAPNSHVVWRDVDNRYYDFDGEYVNHSVTYVPVTDPVSHWEDFARNGIEHEGATEEDIQYLIAKYMYRFPNM